MRKFSAKGTAVAIGPVELLVRLAMYVLPAATFIEQGLGTSAAVAVFLGLVDGNYRFGAYTSRSLVAERRGLLITSGLSVHSVPWSDVSAIQAWQHFYRVDFVAVCYLRAGCLEVATCASRDAEDELRAFVQECAIRVSLGAPRLEIAAAGLCEPSINRPLLKRLLLDVAAITAVGVALGLGSRSVALGLLAASLSAALAAARYSLRATKLVHSNGVWCAAVAGQRGQSRELRPLRAIPRAFRLWVECLAEASSAGRERGSD